MPKRFMVVLVSALTGAGATYLLVTGRAALPEGSAAVPFAAALSFALAVMIERDR